MYINYNGSLQNLCDAANLLFVEKLVTRDRLEVSLVRGFAAVTSKMPMLWCKVSLLAVSYDYMSYPVKRSMIIAIGLSFYATMPVMLPYLFLPPRDSKIGYGIFAVFFLPVCVICSHLIGVWECPSHDFAILALGCTNHTGLNSTNCTVEA